MRIVPGAQHDQVGRLDRAVLQPRTFRTEPVDRLVVQQSDFTLDHQLRAAGVEVVAAAPPPVLHLVTGLVLANVVLEADPLQTLDHVPVEFRHPLHSQPVRVKDQRRRCRGRDQVAVLDRHALVIERIVEFRRRLDGDHGRRTPLDDRRLATEVIQVESDVVG